MAALSGGTGIAYLEYTAARDGLEALRASEEAQGAERAAGALLTGGTPKPAPARSVLDYI